MIITTLTLLQWVASLIMKLVLTHYASIAQCQIQQRQAVNAFQVLLTIYTPRVAESIISEISACKSVRLELNWYATNVTMDSFSQMTTVLVLLNAKQQTAPPVSMLLIITVESATKVFIQMKIGSAVPALQPTVKLVLKDSVSSAKSDTNSSLMDLHVFLTFVKEIWSLMDSHVHVLLAPTFQMIHVWHVLRIVSGAMLMGV